MPINSDQFPEFIDLNRTFHELSEHAGKSDDVDLSQVFHVKNGLTWDNVLKNPRTVILSEAGSGKTQEIRNRAISLRSEGKAAFFLRMELISNDLDLAFEVGTHDEFETWLQSEDAGWLLLDSVDEARLRSPLDFEKAIRRIGKLLESAKSRVTIVLTGRTHAWRPKTDFDLCERHIGYPPQAIARIDISEPVTLDEEADELDEFELIEGTAKEDEQASTKFRILALDDLSKQQVAIFAKATGVSDTPKFLEEIERVDAWSSTARPQDLEEVVALWKKEGRIGSRLDIMRNSVDRRLAERDQMRAEAQPLSDLRVREGAMLLAATATLAQVQIIQVPDGVQNRTGISPKAVLTDWTDREITALLSRPVFDDAIYGTVRFHHRSVREYLTAQWLAGLLKKPASRRAIEALLFANQYGVEVVVPTMRPVLPWLAIFDPRIRERIRRIAPEVVFEGGDPTALPLPTRQEILFDVCHRLSLESALHSATEYAAVQRFAQADIADDIGKLIKQYASNDRVVGFLTRMVWLGRLKLLAGQIKQAAISATASRYTRIAAVRAAKEVCSPEDLRDIRYGFLAEAPSLDRELLGELITDLDASDENINWVLAALTTSANKEKYSVDRLTEAVATFSESARLDQLPQLLAGFRKLAEEEPVIERAYCEISKRFTWLMRPAAKAVERLIVARDGQALHPDSLEIIYKLRAARAWGEDERIVTSEFRPLFQVWPDLNDASFWHDVSYARRFVTRKEGGRLTDFWQAQMYEPFWKFDETHFDKTSDWIESRQDQDDRLVALSLAYTIYHQNGRQRSWRERLQSLCQGNGELEARLELLLNPPRQHTEYQREERKWKRKAAAQTKRREKQEEKDTIFILSHIDLIRDSQLANPSDVSRLQWYLHQKAHEDGSTSKWTDGSSRKLVELYGEEVAQAYRDGAMSYWRKHRPQLRSEGAIANTTPSSVIFGLAGLSVEARKNSLNNISEGEAETATRYALHELNGFPGWFPTFYEDQKAVALKVILDEVSWEVGAATADLDSHYVLSDVSWSGEWAWEDLAPHFLAQLRSAEPENSSQLRQLLKIVQGTSISDGEIAQLAAEKVESAPSKHLPDWFAVWFGVDPSKALPRLAAHLDGMSCHADRTEFAMQFVTKLWGGRRSETFGARGGFKTPTHLKALYVLMHRDIATRDDVERAGTGVFSPGLRDDAQDGRNKILQVLNDISGKESFLALSELAHLSRQTPSAPYLEMLRLEKAQKESDLQPWAPLDVREFHEKQDRTPRTHHELADLAILRLLDFKDDLEEGDGSIAGVIKAISLETVLRNYIGHELREKAFGRYSIPQEEELADKKRPDFRFHGVAIDAPVPAELKIADNWSGPDLFERLENQLAGDYLRDIRSGRGIFVLVWRGEQRRWQLPLSGKLVGFDQLLDALRTHWRQIEQNHPGVEEITIIGIDLTKRSA